MALQGARTQGIATRKLEGVAVSVVTYNSIQVVPRLASVLEELAINGAVVIVVDNASSDGTAELLERRLRDLVKVVRLRSNLGFAAASNIAIRVAIRRGARYILLLNPDVCIDVDTVKLLKNILDRVRALGAVGCTLVNGEFIDTVGGFVDAVLSPGELLHGIHANLLHRLKQLTQLILPSSVCMACALVNVDAVKRVGLLEDKLFIYFEDVEWGLRSWAHGVPIAISTMALAFHQRGKGSERDEKTKKAVRYFAQRNTVVVSLKYWGSRVPLHQFGKIVVLLVASAIRRDRVSARAIIDGIIYAIRSRPQRLPDRLVPAANDPRNYVLFWMLKYMHARKYHSVHVPVLEVGRRVLLRLLRLMRLNAR